MRSRINLIYCDMKQRCFNTNHTAYKHYGGRGISICEQWYTPGKPEGWKNFKTWALTHGYKECLTIDRIDNSKGYSPDNCRWVTPKEQANNTRNNRLISYKGRTQTLAQWCDELKLNYKRTERRLDRKWPIEKAFEIKEDNRIKLITYHGKTQSLIEWCRELNLSYSTTKARLNRSHWTVEKAFCNSNKREAK